jgi:LytR cell envelope-related transcriptional attenuator
MHAIESIGPVLGIVAFVGLAVLAFLLFQQAREIRRVRDWAGRAPERAAEAAEAVQAVADASREGEGEETAVAEGEAAPEPAVGRLRGALQHFWWGVRDRFAAADRRLPIDGRYLLALVVIAVIAVGVVTSGFGLVGGGGGGGGKHGSSAKPKATVAVINGTSVPGLAATVEQQVVKKSGYKSGPVGNATASVNATVVEYSDGMRSDAQKFATAVKKQLGDTPVQPMTSETKAAAGKVDIALVLGLDDAGFGGGG